MPFYQIALFFSICVLHRLVIFRKKKIEFYNDQLIIQKKSLDHVDVNLKLRFLIKSSYYIVPSPSTTLLTRLYSLLL